MPENDFRSATQWILGRREIRMPVENRVCERCGNQLKPEQTSGREFVANILCVGLFLAIVIPGGYSIAGWIDRTTRLIHPVQWHEPHDNGSFF